MSSIVKELIDKNLINQYPAYIKDTQYEVIMGSFAYGVHTDSSDIDIYGFCIPPKNIIFPHLNGEIIGFGKQYKRFENFQQHHIINPDTKKEYDIDIYNIVKYFQLIMQNNPNMIDSLFVPIRCIIHITKIGEHIRENRKQFLHKGSFHTFKGYAFQQLHKIKIKKPEGKRKEIVEKFGYDVKYAMHLIRLLNEVEQILIEHDLDLDRNSQMLSKVRLGTWTLEQIEDWFYNKEKSLETLYVESKLQHSPNENNIKKILLTCLEMYYGNIDNLIKTTGINNSILKDLKHIIEKYETL